MDHRFRLGDRVFRVHPVARDGRTACSVQRLDGAEAAGDPAAPLDVRPVTPGEFVVDGPAGPRRGYAARAGDTVWVEFAGTTWRLTEERTAGRARSTTAAGAIASPMPGKVLRTLVEVGEPVAKGQPLLVVEAMKMQLEISAPHAGTLRSLAAGPGDTVLAGVPLAEVEPAPEATEPEE